MMNDRHLISEITYNLSLVEDCLKSRHLDELCPDFPVNGKKLRYWIEDFFPKLKIALSNVEQNLLVVTIPFPPTKFARVNPPSLDVEPEYDNASPTVYLLDDEDFLSDAVDEIVIEMSNSMEYRCIFRCWRDVISRKKGWEFNNAVYIWSKLIKNKLR